MRPRAAPSERARAIRARAAKRGNGKNRERVILGARVRLRGDKSTTVRRTIAAMRGHNTQERARASLFYFSRELGERKIWNLIARGAFEAFSPAGNGWSRLKTQEMEIEGKGCAMYPNVPMATMIMMRLLLRNNFLSPHQREWVYIYNTLK